MFDIQPFVKPIVSILSPIVSAIMPTYFGTLSISIKGPANIIYFHTSDIDDNKNIYRSQHKFSYTKFRLLIDIRSTYKTSIHYIRAYAFKTDEGESYESKWIELINPRNITEGGTLREFIDKFSQSALSQKDKYAVYMGANDHVVDIDNGHKNILVAKIGMFKSSLIDGNRIIRDRNFCDVLVVIDVNSSRIGLLCSIPEFYNDDECEPVLIRAENFGDQAKIGDIIDWASLHQSDAKLLKHRKRTARFIRKLA